jgi:hypothetical protein
MLTVLGGLAEFERHLILARTSESRQRAQQRGVRFGRKPSLTDHQRQEALARRLAKPWLTSPGATQSRTPQSLAWPNKVRARPEAQPTVRPLSPRPENAGLSDHGLPAIIEELTSGGRDDTPSLAHYLGQRNLQSTARYTALAEGRFAEFWKD